MPLLVRTDTGRFLRASELAPAERGMAPSGAPWHEGRENYHEETKEDPEAVFFVHDAQAGRIAQVPGSMGSSAQFLRLGGIRPALEGTWTLALADGKRVEVTTVFELLRKTLADSLYEPANAAKACGICRGGPPRFRPGVHAQARHDHPRCRGQSLVSTTIS